MKLFLFPREQRLFSPNIEHYNFFEGGFLIILHLITNILSLYSIAKEQVQPFDFDITPKPCN